MTMVPAFHVAKPRGKFRKTSLGKVVKKPMGVRWNTGTVTQALRSPRSLQEYDRVRYKHKWLKATGMERSSLAHLVGRVELVNPRLGDAARMEQTVRVKWDGYDKPDTISMAQLEKIP